MLGKNTKAGHTCAFGGRSEEKIQSKSGENTDTKDLARRRLICCPQRNIWKSFTFDLSFIFGHDLLVLSEFSWRRHGWVWRSNQSSSLRDQLYLNSTDKGGENLNQSRIKGCPPWNWFQRRRRRTEARRESVLSPWLLGSLGTHCEPGAAAAAAGSAAAPCRLLKTGCGANYFERKQSHSLPKTNISGQIHQSFGKVLFSLKLSQTARCCSPSVCPNWSAVFVPLLKWERGNQVVMEWMAADQRQCAGQAMQTCVLLICAHKPANRDI